LLLAFIIAAISLPPSIQEIDGSVFTFSSLEGPRFRRDDNFLVDVTRSNAVRYFGGDEVFVPKSIMTLGNFCFADSSCVSMSISFESGSVLAKIGASCFARCTLKKICVPRSVEFIGEECFIHAEIEEITFESDSRLKSLGNECFTYAALHEICIPRSVQSIGDFCFAGVEKDPHVLKHIAFESDSQVAELGECCFQCCQCLESFSVPDSVRTIGSLCFFRSGLCTICFESVACVSEIGEGCFSRCEWLESICIANSVCSLGPSCFLGSGIETCTFDPDSKLTEIPQKCFQGCAALSSICIPRSVELLRVKSFT